MADAVDIFLWFMGVLLISVRFTFAIALSPIMTAYRVPALARLAVVVAFAAMCTPPTTKLDPRLGEPQMLLRALCAEAVIGALLGASVHVALAAFAVAGRLLDVQIGFGLGSIFDPATQTSVNAISSLLNALGICLFVLAGAHVEFLSMLGNSMAAFPIGRFPEFGDPWKVVTAASGMFKFGLMLAGPVVIALLLTDVVAGVVSRNAPQLNALLLTIPVKLVIGLAILALSVPGWETILAPLFAFGTELLGAAR